MKRISLIAAVSCLLVVVASPAHAQVDLNFFRHSNIAKYLNPVVGKGAEYTSTDKDSAGKTQIMTLGVVGKESFQGKEAFWMEIASDGSGHSILMKMLITRDDFEPHKTVMQMPGQPAMEMPFNGDAEARAEKAEEKFKEWHSVGTEPVTVPAGTFVCEHLHNDKTNGDMWVSDKITPFGMVKHVDGKRVMVLSKLIPDFQERITGPVKQFDPQAFRQKRDANQ